MDSRPEKRFVEILAVETDVIPFPDSISEKRDTQLVLCITIVCSILILGGVIAGIYYVATAKNTGRLRSLN